MISRLIYSILVLLSAFIALLFMGEIQPPVVGPRLTPIQIEAMSQFFPKEKNGVHNVFLTGNDFQRGQQFGYWTKDLLIQQEQAMVAKLDQIFPSSFLQHALFVMSMGWFNGLDDFFEEHWKREMYGVTLSTPLDRLFFSTIYTRQLAYHGVHDMGQMMIDNGLVLGACTQLAVPKKQGWLIGRNFDFEAGPIFDEDKVMKWVFPDKGEPYVSVLFSGMVGVITGINIHG
ncbi:MAG: hypothetical protein HRT44_12115, partial [Bdellovibrionales bacterium]|nr:hypothetical protein [Bdellovibrionales bacterium]NQZ19984.1 hypothetical protein [Bdellovibrionales bacterium]